MTMTTTMVRFQRVAQLWNWLPGFRGVAEHESVHQAAEALAVSPSSLSRTVKLLESALGAPLFVRRSGGLERTPLGDELLALTRSAMRSVDDCISREEARRGGTGPLFVGVTSDVGAALIARTIARHAGETAPIHVSHIDEDSGSQELLRGSVDLVLAHTDTRDRGIVGSHLGEATFGIYAAHDHPHGREQIANELEGAAFVASTFGPLVPAGARVVCTCESSDIARTVCESSKLLCVLPDVLVDETPSLRRIAAAGDPLSVHALRRAPTSPAADETQLVRLVSYLQTTLAG